MKMNKQSYQEEFDMNTSFISTQQIKDLINEQKFTSTQEIMNCMKNMFPISLNKHYRLKWISISVMNMRKEEMMMLKRIIATVPLKER